MILGEPAPSGGDLHFRLFGFPVRVHPFFWIATLLLGYGGGSAEPLSVLIWMVVVLVSILVHELGHAVTQRHFGGHPWITLHGFGGLASCQDCDRSPRSQILISLAGPIAGFLLAAATVIVVAVLGHTVGAIRSNQEFDWEAVGITSAIRQPLLLFDVYFEPFRSELTNNLVAYLLQVNILWGLINLLPIYPLDGGQVARELFTLRSPRRGIILSLQLSIGTAAAMAVYSLLQQRFYTFIMFALLAYGSYQAWKAYRDHWR